MALAALDWPDDEATLGRRPLPGDERRRIAAVGRAEEEYRRRVDDQADRADRRGALIAELADAAGEMVELARRRELSPQHIATARRLTARADKALRLLEAEER